MDHSSEFIDLQKSHGSEKLNISMTPANIGISISVYRIKVKLIEHPSYVGQIRNKFGMTVIFVDAFTEIRD